jgi:hypothetical protein
LDKVAMVELIILLQVQEEAIVVLPILLHLAAVQEEETGLVRLAVDQAAVKAEILQVCHQLVHMNKAMLADQD